MLHLDHHQFCTLEVGFAPFARSIRWKWVCGRRQHQLDSMHPFLWSRVPNTWTWLMPSFLEENNKMLEPTKMHS